MIKTISQSLKNIGFNFIADLSIRLSKTLLIIIISRFLGVASMGAISIGLTYLGFGILFSNWGFGNLLTREIVRDQTNYNKYLTNYAILRIIFASIAILVINLIVTYLNYSKETILVIRIISFSLIPTTIIRLYFSTFISFEKPLYICIISLISNLLRLVISFTAVLFQCTIIHLAIIYSTVEFLSLIMSTFIIIRFLPKYKVDINLKFALSEIIRAFPFLGIGILTMLDARSDILIISLFFTETDVGYYTAVYTILGGLTLISEAIQKSIFPIVVKYQKSSPTKLKEIGFFLSKYVLIVTVPLSILVFIFSEELVSLLFGNKFQETTILLKILIWTFISYSLTIILSSLLIARDKEKFVGISLLVSGIFSVILDLIFVQFFGVTGIALIRLLSSLIMFILCLYFHFTTTGFGVMKLNTTIRIFLGGTLMYVLCYFLITINKILALVTGLLIFITALLILRVIKPKDIELWQKITKEFFPIFNFTDK